MSRLTKWTTFAIYPFAAVGLLISKFLPGTTGFVVAIASFLALSVTATAIHLRQPKIYRTWPHAAYFYCKIAGFFAYVIALRFVPLTSSMPFSILLFATLLNFVILSKSSRDHSQLKNRLLHRLCLHCGYDLRASPTLCSECGKPPPPLVPCQNCQLPIPPDFKRCPSCLMPLKVQPIKPLTPA